MKHVDICNSRHIVHNPDNKILQKNTYIYIYTSTYMQMLIKEAKKGWTCY